MKDDNSLAQWKEVWYRPNKKPFYNIIRLFPSVLLKALFILNWMVSLIPHSLIFPPPGRHWSVSLPGSPRQISSTATVYSFPRMLTWVYLPIISNPWGLAIFSKPYDESNFQSAWSKKSTMSLKHSCGSNLSYICKAEFVWFKHLYTARAIVVIVASCSVSEFVLGFEFLDIVGYDK